MDVIVIVLMLNILFNLLADIYSPCVQCLAQMLCNSK